MPGIAVRRTASLRSPMSPAIHAFATDTESRGYPHSRAGRCDLLASPVAQRQGHRHADAHRVLDAERRLEGRTRVLRGRESARPTGGEMIEPGARLVCDRAPELAERPVARRAALQEHH